MNIDTTAYKKSSFGPAFLFLGKPRREALAVYYAFCRLMDDIADEPGVESRVEKLDFWREEIGRVFANKAQTPLGCELQKITTTFGLAPDRFLLLIDGMQADVEGRTYGTFEELTWYLWRVAGIVGLATLDILGVKGTKAETLARKLGFAVQLTNIVRDVREDAQLGRVYIPADQLNAHQLSLADLLRPAMPEALPGVLAELAQKAHDYYEQAGRQMGSLPRSKMRVCKVMSFVYQANLAKIEKTGFRFDRAVKLSKFEKIKACIYALFKNDTHY